MKEAGVPKGSFYFHFESKEKFGLELIDVYSDFMGKKMDEIMSDTSQSGITRLRNFIDFTKTMFESENFVGGCPLGNLALEMGDVNENFRMKISKGFEQMESHISKCLLDSQNAEEISKDIDVKSAAKFILNSWEGALVRMKVEKSNNSLDLLGNYIFDYILK